MGVLIIFFNFFKSKYLYCVKHSQVGERNHYWKGGKKKAQCLFCNKEFVYYTTNELGKFCSHKCHGKWNVKTKKWLDENNPYWKGDKVGYDALYTWISRKLGKAKICDLCGEVKMVNWASKTYKYTRDLGDYQALCVWCHRNYDRKNGWGKAKEKFYDR